MFLDEAGLNVVCCCLLLLSFVVLPPYCGLLLGTIVNGTYGTHKTPIYLPVFTHNIWSYLLWSPVAAEDDEVACAPLAIACAAPVPSPCT